MCASLTFLKSSPSSVHRKHGLLGLYKGLEAKLLQTVLTAALMFVVYEKITAATFKLMGLQRKLKHWHTGAFIHDYLSNTPSGRAPHIPSVTAPLTWAHLGKVQSRFNTGQVKARKKALVFNILLKKFTWSSLFDQNLKRKWEVYWCETSCATEKYFITE